mmetsp:Transcript_17041/g.42242  ORF Transcript_17041/g.42242 Transcript_17041/m.42242 type:complete len:269 (+) Transcript_17041:2416-3222(+)
MGRMDRMAHKQETPGVGCRRLVGVQERDEGWFAAEWPPDAFQRERGGRGAARRRCRDSAHHRAEHPSGRGLQRVGQKQPGELVSAREARPQGVARFRKRGDHQEGRDLQWIGRKIVASQPLAHHLHALPRNRPWRRSGHLPVCGAEPAAGEDEARCTACEAEEEGIFAATGCADAGADDGGGGGPGAGEGAGGAGAVPGGQAGPGEAPAEGRWRGGGEGRARADGGDGRDGSRVHPRGVPRRDAAAAVFGRLRRGGRDADAEPAGESH